MQSSFDFPLGDTSSRELLQEDELLATTCMISLDEPPDEEEEDNFAMDTPHESRTDLEILSPIKLSMLSTQLLATSQPTAAGSPLPSSLKNGEKSVDRGRAVAVAVEGLSSAAPRRQRKVVEFANFEENSEVTVGKQKRTDSTDAALQAKIFAEIKK